MSFRILIADDEPLIRMDLRELLEGLGHEVVAEARDGKEALDLANREKPDIVILDIKMPRLSGIEVAKEVASSFPVVMLSAYSDKSLIDQAKDAGVMAYLTKPFREDNIAPALELAVTHFVEKSSLSAQVSRLKEEIETRKLVQRATGLIMGSEHVSEAQAFRKIQKMSMDKNKSMRQVAEAIILTLG